jgi:hypothetical protein
MYRIKRVTNNKLVKKIEKRKGKKGIIKKERIKNKTGKKNGQMKKKRRKVSDLF